jgi:hypothetical protein
MTCSIAPDLTSIMGTLSGFTDRTYTAQIAPIALGTGTNVFAVTDLQSTNAFSFATSGLCLLLPPSDGSNHYQLVLMTSTANPTAPGTQASFSGLFTWQSTP